MLKRLAFLLSMMFSFVSSGLAQINPNEYEEEKPILLRNEQTFGVFIHSGGNGLNWGLDYKKGKQITVKLKRIYEFEFLTMKHPKEIRSVNPYVDGAKSFIYGKQNVLMILRGGYGRQKILSNQFDKSGMEIRLAYSGGFSLGLAKPVYLSIIKETSNPYVYNVVVEKYDPKNADQDISHIYGRASFFKGFDQIKPYPGAYGKLGMQFLYGSSDDNIKAFEVGIQLDAYAKKIPIMAYAENYQYFFNVYFTFLFGKKW